MLVPDTVMIEHGGDESPDTPTLRRGDGRSVSLFTVPDTSRKS